jgi:hypothetical protein
MTQSNQDQFFKITVVLTYLGIKGKELKWQPHTQGSLCAGRELKRTLAKAAEHHIICCIFPGEYINYQEQPGCRLLFCLFIDIAHSIDRYCIHLWHEMGSIVQGVKKNAIEIQQAVVHHKRG